MSNKSNTLTHQKTINIRGRLVELDKPKVMGIINVTPDSFFEGSRVESMSDILSMAESMLEDGAVFLDVGGYSSRPDAPDISEFQEISRVVNPIRQIREHFPEAIISIDTFRSSVAKAAVAAGADIVNDISGGLLDNEMMKTVAELKVPYILMHMRGTPQTMKQLSDYNDLIKEVTYYFSAQLSVATGLGLKDVIIDPGFGFAKTTDQNFKLLNHLDYLTHLGRPVLVGLSRKSMIYKTLKIDPETALNGTTVLNTVALLKGASILRVHDVKEAVETIKLVNTLGT